MCVNDVWPQPRNELRDALRGRVHNHSLIENRYLAERCRPDARAMEAHSSDVFFHWPGSVMLRRSEMKRLPAEGTLLTE